MRLKMLRMAWMSFLSMARRCLALYRLMVLVQGIIPSLLVWSIVLSLSSSHQHVERGVIVCILEFGGFA